MSSSIGHNRGGPLEIRVSGRVINHRDGEGLALVTPPKLGAVPVIGVTIIPTEFAWVAGVAFALITGEAPCELGSVMELLITGMLGLVAAGVCAGPNDGVAALPIMAAIPLIIPLVSSKFCCSSV